MPDFNNPKSPWNDDFSNGSQQQYIQNPNNTYNNNYNNNNDYNNYQGNINPQNPYIPNGNMGYIPSPQPNPKSSKLIYIILIAVIVFFAVIIVLMSTSMRAMFNGGDNQTGGNNQNNIVTTENQQETTKEQTTEEVTSEETTTTKQTTTTTTTEPIPETITVTVIVEVEKEVVKEVIKEVEVPVQKDYTNIYGDYYYGYVSTQKDPLNIRSGAGENYKVIGSIPKGTYIYVQTAGGNGWYYTTYNGISGYVSASYVTLDMSDAYYGYDNGYYRYSTATVKTNGSNLYLRDSASMNGNILDKMPNGTTITVIEYGSNWCYVEYNGTRGYASTDYLSF